MGGRPTSKQTLWIAAGGLYLAVATVGTIGLRPHRSAASQFPPVAVGAIVGFAAGLAVLTAQARLQRSERWMGRPRFFDWLSYIVAFTVTYALGGWFVRLDHSGELFTGLLDGVMVAAVIHLARRESAPPDTSLPA